MTTDSSPGVKKNFLGNSPDWYEKSIIAFLAIKPTDT